MRKFFWAKQSDTETPEDHLKKLIVLENSAILRILARSYSYQKSYHQSQQMVEKRRFRRAESSRTNGTKYIRQKEQKEHYTGSTNIKLKNEVKEEPMNIYREIRNNTERKTKKKTKLQILQYARLEPQTQMSTMKIDMPQV